jgi:hypothetical protein
LKLDGGLERIRLFFETTCERVACPGAPEFSGTEQDNRDISGQTTSAAMTPFEVRSVVRGDEIMIRRMRAIFVMRTNVLASIILTASALARVLAASVLAPAIAAAQTYPVRPITIVVPFAAGGPTDVLARVIGEHIRTDLGQPVLIENVTGAGRLYA